MKRANGDEVCERAAHSSRIGETLRRRRTEGGFTLEELAHRVHVTKGYLSRVERGKAKPSKRLIGKLAASLSVDAAALYLAAGYLPDDIRRILDAHPFEASDVLREAFAEYGVSPTKQRLEGDKVAEVGTGWPPLAPYGLIEGDCFQWLDEREANSIHAIVTDPPYGLVEYSPHEKAKLREGRGGVWRIPPTLDGHTRSPLPRFTVLADKEKAALRDFFSVWAGKAIRVLVPGGHVFIATNPLVSHILYAALEAAGFEKRGEVIRLVQTLRGGDRPKNAHEEFRMVSVMPRSCWEPWGVFRRPCEGRVQDNLRTWKTGGLRRESEERPFCDVIPSAPARGREREIASHPSLKPQAFMRQIVRASLPLGEGVVLDTFMGSGSTIAAARAVGYASIGIESDPEFYTMAVRAVPRLATLAANGNGPRPPAARTPMEQESLFV
jgi:site-specific DNA-methyltransferase (adenine-specific)